MAILGDSIATMFRTMADTAKLNDAAWAAYFHGKFALAAQLWEERNKVWDRAEADQKKRAEETYKRWTNPPELPTGTGATPVDEALIAAANREAARKDRLALAAAQTGAALAIEKARNKLVSDENQRAYDQGLVSIRDYYAKRRDLAQADYEAELKALTDTRLQAGLEDNEGKKLVTVAKINGEIGKLKVEHANEMSDLSAKESDALEKNAKQQLDLDGKVAAARGEQHQQRLKEIGEEAEASRVAWVRGGMAPDEADRLAAARRDFLQAQEDFPLRAAEADRALGDLGRQRDQIQREIDAGLLSETIGNERIIGLQREKLGILQMIADDMAKTAAQTGDPARIQQAAQFADQVDEVSKAVEKSEGNFRQFKARGIDAARQSLEDFLAEGVNDAKTFEDVWKGVFLSVASSLQRLAAQFLATSFITAIFGKGAPSAGATGAATQATDLYVGAGGGLVLGPGTGTSDSIPARLSSGEYVVRARSVAGPGVLGLLESINAGLSVRPVQRAGFRRFADGGLASAGGPGGAPLPAARMEGSVLIGLEDGLIARAIESSAGERAVLRIVTKHRRGLGRTLG